MHIHKEGYQTLKVSGAALLVLNTLGYVLLPRKVFYGVFGVSGATYALLTSFFRSPARQTPVQPNTIFAPADGVVVNIERVRETEYFNDERLVVSIFLSVFNVHINWVPIQGKVTYFQYHPGQYLVAFHPKSSELNERSTIVIESQNGIPVLVRQIAGILARRIETYVVSGQHVQAGQELGFIKFGSRVDIYLPVNSQIKVALYQPVTGAQTPLAEL